MRLIHHREIIRQVPASWTQLLQRFPTQGLPKQLTSHCSRSIAVQHCIRQSNRHQQGSVDIVQYRRRLKECCVSSPCCCQWDTLLPGMRLGSLSQRFVTGGAAVMGISVLFRRHQHRQQQARAQPLALAVTSPMLPDAQPALYSRVSEPYSFTVAAASALPKSLLGLSLARGSSIVAFCLLTVALGCMAALPAVVSVSASALLATAVSRLLPEVASAVVEAKPQQVVDRSVLETVTGTWTKDFKHSSSMESFFELFKVPSIVRRAAILIRGMSIVMDDANLSVTMLCALPWFNVTETYPLSGAPGEAKRRDMRRGKQLGRVETQPDGSIKLKLSWDDPMAGSSMDELRLTDGGQELHVLCRASVGEGRARFEAVYRRKAVVKGKDAAAVAAAAGGRVR